MLLQVPLRWTNNIPEAVLHTYGYKESVRIYLYINLHNWKKIVLSFNQFPKGCSTNLKILSNNVVVCLFNYSQQQQ